jgi:hypothetical protein
MSGFPNSSLGIPKPKLRLRETGSWGFQICIPKLELGNEYKKVIVICLDADLENLGNHLNEERHLGMCMK